MIRVETKQGVVHYIRTKDVKEIIQTDHVTHIIVDGRSTDLWISESAKEFVERMAEIEQNRNND